MTSNLRILVAHNVPRARSGGMSRIMGFIHDRLVAQGHQVDYFCSDDIPPKLNGRLSRFTFPWLVRRHARQAARRGQPYHVINVHEPSAVPVCVWRQSLGNPVIVVTSHGMEKGNWDLFLEEARLGREGPSLKTQIVYPLTSLWQSNLSLRRADHLFLLKFEDRDYLEQRWQIPPRKTTRIFPGVDPIYARAARNRDYQRGDRLLFAATWRKFKGIEDLVPAFVTLATRRPDLTLTVLGAGVPAERVLAAFPEVVRSRVQCVQSANDEENAAHFAAADVFLLPSLYEGTPLTLMEAMASGLPIVTTATSGMKDVLHHGQDALLVPIRSPGAIVECVEQLVADGSLRARLGQAAQAEALSKYSWDQAARPVQEAYERIVTEKL